MEAILGRIRGEYQEHLNENPNGKGTLSHASQ